MHVKDNNALSMVVEVVGKVRGGIYEIFGQQKQTGTENGKKKPNGKDTCGPILSILDTTIHCDAASARAIHDPFYFLGQSQVLPFLGQSSFLSLASWAESLASPLHSHWTGLFYYKRRTPVIYSNFYRLKLNSFYFSPRCLGSLFMCCSFWVFVVVVFRQQQGISSQ